MGDPSGEGASVRARYEWSETSPSVVVVDAIAAIENVPPVELSGRLDTTLYESLDPEALDTLVTPDGGVSIAFSFDKYSVRIDDDGLTVDFR